MLIFLDFDGVLHPLSKSDFSCVHYLNDLIKVHDDIKFVFSTSWREFNDLEKLKEFMPEELRAFCIGKTPVLSDQKHVRFHEIQEFLRANNMKDQEWIALDDNSYLFPSDCDNLFLIHNGGGLNDELICKLSNKITAQKESRD